jgi:hypothetical protein
MKKIIYLFLLISFTFCSKDYSQITKQTFPRIRQIPELKMLTIEVTGDPNETVGDGFEILYKSAYKLKGGPLDGIEMRPRGRWLNGINGPSLPRSEWKAILAIPVSSEITDLPEGLNPKVKLEKWEYGDIAEILHTGSYATEIPTVEKLHKYIKENGYEIIGNHEEVYVRGPGMFFKGNPDEYLTLIRYQVKKEMGGIKPLGR